MVNLSVNHRSVSDLLYKRVLFVVLRRCLKKANRVSDEGRTVLKKAIAVQSLRKDHGRGRTGLTKLTENWTDADVDNFGRKQPV